MGDIVYSEARHTAVVVLTAEDAEGRFRPDAGIEGSHALFIGDDLGLVVEGDLADLRRVAGRIMAAVVRAQDVESLPGCTGAPDLCGARAGHQCEPGCPSLATEEAERAEEAGR